MANRNFPCQRQFGFHLAPVKLDFSMSVTGASGALGATANPGQGITSITRLAAGVYQLQLNDNYPSYLDSNFRIETNLGSTAAASAASTTALSSISSLGTTTTAQWHTAGVPAGITPAVGVVFVAAAAATAVTGTGTVKPVVADSITSIQICGDPNLMLSNQPFQSRSGGYITFACVAAKTAGTAAADATPTITDPAAGTVITGSIWLNNSSGQ